MFFFFLPFFLTLFFFLLEGLHMLQFSGKIISNEKESATLTSQYINNHRKSIGLIYL